MITLLKRLFGSKAHTSNESVPQTRMSAEERAVIVAFARGDKTLRAKAIDIHRNWIDRIGVRGTPEQDFMAEVDHPVPDYNMRDMYRRRLLDEAAKR